MIQDMLRWVANVYIQHNFDRRQTWNAMFIKSTRKNLDLDKNNRQNKIENAFGCSNFLIKTYNWPIGALLNLVFLFFN